MKSGCGLYETFAFIAFEQCGVLLSLLCREIRVTTWTPTPWGSMLATPFSGLPNTFAIAKSTSFEMSICVPRSGMAKWKCTPAMGGCSSAGTTTRTPASWNMSSRGCASVHLQTHRPIWPAGKSLCWKSAQKQTQSSHGHLTIRTPRDKITYCVFFNSTILMQS